MATTKELDESVVQSVMKKILSVGVDGVGPIKGAREIADEHLLRYSDPDVAIQKVIATHARLVTATGFATRLRRGVCPTRDHSH